MSTGRNTTTRDQHRAAIKRHRPPCGICHADIDYTLRSPDPRSYVVDHIQPLNKGGTDTLDNKQAAHRDCNRTKSDRVTRRVVLICGAPGAGKTTLAHSLGLPVFDVDDPQWDNNETLFRAALEHLANKRDAQAAVIRAGATLAARQAAANLCGATQVIVLTPDLDTCIQQIKARARTDKLPIRTQIAAAQDWWAKYEPADVVVSAPTVTGERPRVFATARSW